MSTTSRAALIGVGTFVVCVALCLALYIALDISLLFLVAPVIIVGFASHSAYKSALEEGSR